MINDRVTKALYSSPRAPGQGRCYTAAARPLRAVTAAGVPAACEAAVQRLYSSGPGRPWRVFHLLGAELQRFRAEQWTRHGAAS